MKKDPNKYGDVWISICRDCGENEGGYFCQVYSDKYMEDEIDYFCIHCEDCDCTNQEEIEKFIEEYSKMYKGEKIMNENNMKITTVENFAEILTKNIMSKNEESWNWNDYSFVYYDEAITGEHMWCGIHYVDTGFDSFDPNFITDIYGGGCPNIYSIDLDMDKELIKNEFEKIILSIINKTGPILDVDEDAIVLIEKCDKEDN